MQYGMNVDTYKRVKKNSTKVDSSSKKEVIKIIVEFLFVFLISRVVIKLDISTIDNIAPFGIAVIIAVFMSFDRREALIVSIGGAIGYLTMLEYNTEMGMYVGIVLVMIVYNSVIGYKLAKKTSIFINIMIILGVMIISRSIVNNYSFGTTVVFSFVQTIIIYPIYYIIDFSMKCFNEMESNHYYSNEEIVGMALIICLAVSGIGNQRIFGINIRNIISLSAVIILSYSLGASVGGVIGIILGAVTGISSNDMIQIISIYALVAVVVGIFKDTGKIYACGSAIIIYIMLTLYCKIFNIASITEGIIGCCIFLLIPNEIIKKINIEFDNTVKEDKLNEFHFDKIKEEFSDKLNDYTDVLASMAVIIKKISENSDVPVKSTASGLVDDVANRACGKCDMKGICWKREFHRTYSDFSELITNYENGKKVMPKDLDMKCIKRYNVMKCVEEVVNAYFLEQLYKKKLEGGYNMMASEVNNMAVTVGELIDDLNRDMCVCSDTERTINMALSRGSIKYDNVLCYNNKYGRLNIKITLDECGGGQYCVKEILPIINKALGCQMIVGGDGCCIDPVSKKCNVLIEESPRFYVTSYCQTACKDGEDSIGDSFSFGKTKDGRYTIIISDGMGSGADAGRESGGIVELIDKYTKAGFSDITAINAANSIMSMKFSEEEKFATLDMQDIDLYTGKIYFTKIGSVETFVKKSKSIQIISSKTLPFGILDKPDIDIVEKTVENGDIIVSVSDGILDVGENKNNYRWLNTFLMQNNTKDPKQLSLEIIEEAKRLNKDKVKDDMTVIVSKVYSI